MYMRWFRVVMALALATALRADVKTQEKSQIHFEGMMGRMVGLFGGNAMREGAINTAAVRGNRKMTVSESTGQIIDLGEEKIYELDMRGKSYKVTTFDEMRRRMQEAREKAAQQPRGESKAPEKETGQNQNQKQMEIDFDLKESGEKKTINGFDCHEVVMTITVREKGKTLEEAGGMVMTSHLWLGPEIAAMKELQEFDRKYAEKMSGPFSFGDAAAAPQMAAAMAMYPMMKDAIGKFQTENVNMKGTSILTVMTMEAVQSAEQAAAQQQQQQRQESGSTTDVTSVRGIGGLIGKKMAARRKTESDASSSSGPKTRATVMTMNHELVSVATSVGAGDVAIPAGFKEKK
jgi:hypothetical protein